MGIFALNQKNEEQQEQPPSTQVEENNDKEIQKQLQSGESKKTEKLEKEEKPSKNVEIVLTGPLGHIYTQALNALLSKEDAGTMLKVFDEYESNDENSDENDYDDSKSYVYVADGSKLQQPDIVDAYNHILNFKNTYPKARIIVGLESEKGFSRASNTFDRCLTEMGVKVYYKRSSITDAISSIHKK